MKKGFLKSTSKCMFVSRLVSLSGLRNLSKLTCSHLQLFESSFAHMHSLRNLEIRQCEFSEFDKHSWWQHLRSSLESLVLDSPRNLTAEHVVDFGQLVSLKLLALHGVFSQPVENILRAFKSSRLMSLSVSKIASSNEFWTQIQHFASTLESLSVCGSQIDVGYSMFENLRLKSLSLINCHINTIKFNSTLLENHLTSLILTGTPLNIIDIDVRLPNLEELDLSFCGLDKLSNGMFRHLARLKILNLNGNKLKSLDAHQFPDLKCLMTLQLEYNLLREVRADSFVGLDSLTRLELNQMSLTMIEPSTFVEFPESLRCVGLNQANKVNKPRFEDLYGERIVFEFKYAYY